MAENNIGLHIFLAGSERGETKALAEAYGAHFAVFPNKPLGAKHNRGLRAIRDLFAAHPVNAIAISGSDDLINEAFFVHVKKLMSTDDPLERMHIVGLRDVHFMDLNSTRLVYTKGYRVKRTPVAATVGCGRVFSWAMLETLDWDLWEWDRDRSLDQSALRRVLNVMPQIAEVSHAIPGDEMGIVAIDVKTDAYEKDANIWRFEQILVGVGKQGPLHEYEERNARNVMNQAFGDSFYDDMLQDLRRRMGRGERTLSG